MKNELPLILPMTPADSPKKNIRTRYGPMARYSRRFSAQITPMTATIATTTHATAATTPMTILNSTYAATASTPTATTLPPRPWSAPPLRFSMFSLMCQLEQVRGSRGHVSVKPRKRDGAHHPARPVDREAERAQTPQEPPRERRREHAQVLGLLGHRDAVESGQDDRHQLAGGARDRGPDVAVRADPAERRGLARGLVDRGEAGAVAAEELVQRLAPVTDSGGLESLPFGHRSIGLEDVDARVGRVGLLGAVL